MEHLLLAIYPKFGSTFATNGILNVDGCMLEAQSYVGECVNDNSGTQTRELVWSKVP